jgi:hypothetical protein
MTASQFRFLVVVLGGFGTVILIQLWWIESKLHKIYEAIGTWGTAIESGIRKVRQ